MEENENIIDNLINNLLQDTRIEGAAQDGQTGSRC